jgi:hypothetical protein
MPEEYTFLLNKLYLRESRTDFPGKREYKYCRDPGKSGTGNPGNETLLETVIGEVCCLLVLYGTLLFFLIKNTICAMHKARSAGLS